MIISINQTHLVAATHLVGMILLARLVVVRMLVVGRALLVAVIVGVGIAVLELQNLRLQVLDCRSEGGEIGLDGHCGIYGNNCKQGEKDKICER